MYAKQRISAKVQLSVVAREATEPKAARPKVPNAFRAPQQVGEKDPDILALEETLSDNLGLKVSIYDRGQSGEIVLTYDSLSQLDEILKRLGEGY